MPYDPVDNADALRSALSELAARERLSPQSILDMFNEAKPTGSRLSISLATLQRFIEGKDISKIRELRFLWELLEQHPDYGKYTRNGLPVVVAPPPPSDFGTALAAFFSNPSTEANLAAARVGFPGVYIMTRRDYDERDALPDGVRVSRLHITETSSGLLVEERQDYQQREDVAGHRQRDTGYLFAYGKYLYFLLKDVTGSAVKLGVIKYHEPERGSDVQIFEGMLYVASNRSTFPRARFFCRRGNGDAMSSGYARLGDIPDTMARNHIAKDFE